MRCVRPRPMSRRLACILAAYWRFRLAAAQCPALISKPPPHWEGLKQWIFQFSPAPCRWTCKCRSRGNSSSRTRSLWLHLFRPQRIGKPHPCRARRERLLLARMRRPAGEKDHLECRAYAAIRIAETFGVDLGSAQKNLPPCRASQPLGKRIGRAHRAQIGHQGEKIVVANSERLAVGNGQGKPGPLQQATHVAHIGEGRDARRCAAGDLRFRLAKRLAQFSKAAATNNGADKQSVG